MSKATLKKLLRTMSADDLAALVLEVYDARKEAKEYLEYYVNPDITAKYDKAIEAIDKELHRSSRSHYKARMSRVRETVKHFMTYAPDSDITMKLLSGVTRRIVEAVNRYYVSQTFINGVVSMMQLSLKIAADAGIAGEFLVEARRLTSLVSTDHSDGRMCRRLLDDVIDEFVTAHNADTLMG